MNCKIVIGSNCVPALSLLALVLGVSCRTASPLPPVDVMAPGWTVRQGQALWKPPGHRPELAGDLLLATNTGGNYFIQFVKDPLPLVTAEVSGDRWQIEFGVAEYTRIGRGAPPRRFAWFQLPAALRDGTVAAPWRFGAGTGDSWRLVNPDSGEVLEGRFFR